MSKETTILALGVLVIIVPFLGVPSAWRTAVLVLAGLGLLVIGFLLRSEAMGRGEEHTSRHPFVESTGPRHSAPIAEAHVESHHAEHGDGMTSLN